MYAFYVLFNDISMIKSVWAILLEENLSPILGDIEGLCAMYVCINVCVGGEEDPKLRSAIFYARIYVCLLYDRHIFKTSMIPCV